MLVNDGDLGKCNGDALEAGVDKVQDHDVKGQPCSGFHDDLALKPDDTILRKA